MRIHFHGAAHTVTGSQHLLEINGHRLLLDCGLYQGRRDETYSRNLNFAHDPRKVDAVILSHAHIDHCGNLPNLVKKGYEGNIFATRATVDLASLMMADSGRIQGRCRICKQEKTGARRAIDRTALYRSRCAASG